MRHTIMLHIIKPSASIPDFLDWCGTLPSNALDKYGYPVASAAIDIAARSLMEIEASEFGIIERSYSAGKNGLLTDCTITFRSRDDLAVYQEAYQFASGPGEPIMVTADKQKTDSKGNLMFYTPLAYLRKKYSDTFKISVFPKELKLLF